MFCSAELRAFLSGFVSVEIYERYYQINLSGWHPGWHWCMTGQPKEENEQAQEHNNDNNVFGSG